MAARLERRCEPGGVLVSGTAYDHLQGKLAMALEPAGEHKVKNLARPVRVYRVRREGGKDRPRSLRVHLSWPLVASAVAMVLLTELAGSAWWSWPGDGAASDKPTVAVLPFDDPGGDEATRRPAGGPTEDIITDLARFGDLDVIARNSTAAYRGKAVDVRRIGAELDVGHVVKGSIQRQGERIRVTAQLIDARTGAHRWADRWDRPTADIFAVQAEVAEAVAGAIGGTNSVAAVTSSRIAEARRRPPAKLTGYEHFLLAVDGKAKRTRETVLAGLEHASTAIALDPGLSRAYAPRAFLHYFAAVYTGTTDAASRLTEADARRAVELDLGDPEARAALAFACFVKGELPQARDEVMRAVGDGPANIHVLVMAALVLPFAGAPELGAAYADKALRLDPRMLPGNSGALVSAYFFTRRFEDALAALRRVPRESYTRRLAFSEAASLAQLGRTGEMGPAKELLLARFPNTSAELALARDLRVVRPEEAGLIVDSFRKLGLPVCARPEDLAALGNRERLEGCHAVAG